MRNQRVLNIFKFTLSSSKGIHFYVHAPVNGGHRGQGAYKSESGPLLRAVGQKQRHLRCKLNLLTPFLALFMERAWQSFL